MVGISFEYRLRWRHGTTPAECVADAKSAVRWVRSHAVELGVDPERIVAAGFSAGGHLAAAVGMVPGDVDSGDDKKVSTVPNAMVLMSAAVDVDDPYFREILAGHGDVVDYDPVRHIRSGLPPAIVFHGLDDNYFCPFPKTDAFCKALQAAGNRCELTTFNGGHFRNSEDWVVIDRKTDKFLASLGYMSPSTK
jgi:acetyl esterase/lipase